MGETVGFVVGELVPVPQTVGAPRVGLRGGVKEADTVKDITRGEGETVREEVTQDELL